MFKPHHLFVNDLERDGYADAWRHSDAGRVCCPKEDLE